MYYLFIPLLPLALCTPFQHHPLQPRGGSATEPTCGYDQGSYKQGNLACQDKDAPKPTWADCKAASDVLCDALPAEGADIVSTIGSCQFAAKRAQAVTPDECKSHYAPVLLGCLNEDQHKDTYNADYLYGDINAHFLDTKQNYPVDDSKPFFGFGGLGCYSDSKGGKQSGGGLTGSATRKTGAGKGGGGTTAGSVNIP